MTSYTSRKDVPDYEKWDLTDIYSSEDLWKADFLKVEDLAKDLKTFDGAITDAQSLLDFLTKQEELGFIFSKVFVYARLQVDLDTRESSSQELVDKATQLSVKVSSSTSFFTPFLLSLKEETLKSYIAEIKELAYFEDDLFETYRYKAHILSKEKEELLSELGETLSSPSKTFGMMNNADIQFGEVTNDKGEKVQLTRGMYSKLIEDKNRGKRQEAYKAYYKPYVQLNHSIASTLSSAIKTNVTLSTIRGYSSALEKSLFGDLVPGEVYDNLIETTKKHIAPLHRYSEIRKDVLGLDDLRQYDLNVPLVQESKEEIPYEKAYDIMLNALSPLGTDYIDILRTFKEKRYIDVRETPGKRSGAYNMGLYGVHPFVLLNHQDDLDSLFTLVHEMGHAMHSYYSNKYQPQITAGYTIFVAEVASTVNEVLLINYLLNNETDAKKKKHLLNHFIDMFRGTFFTQIMFAEFEKRTHEMAQQQQPLNASSFNELYGELFRSYQGDVVTFDDEVKYGWSRIPHFYRPFYVYKYATGFAAAIQIADKLLSGEKEGTEAYLTFLKSGSSDYPLELLKKAGVDLSNPDPIEHALSYFGELLSEFEKL
ncbi:oligoendopeptidase F [Bacillus solitudinis]|uniref:oligoendopeptidase F n=1 Tax=Bacillus solitudinis TaxID=2014074 RepID=UPI000C238CB5|nr:oligoendopeptidase F [Bacillus solitudinis]